MPFLLGFISRFPVIISGFAVVFASFAMVFTNLAMIVRGFAFSGRGWGFFCRHVRGLNDAKHPKGDTEHERHNRRE
jgi:hypothetical protein